MGVKKTMDTFFASLTEQTFRGYGSRILSTPMGPFRWDDNLNVWINVNNGFQLHNIAFQDMYAMMDYSATLGGDGGIIPYFTVYGSTVVTSFLNAALKSTDSVEFITIGDSNTGTCGGYQYGWEFAFRNKGITFYGTGIFPTQTIGTANVNVVGDPQLSHLYVTKGVTLSWPGSSTLSADNSGNTMAALSIATDASGVSMRNFLGYTYGSSNEANMIKPLGFTYDVNYLPTGKTFTSPANNNRIMLTNSNTLLSGTTMEYRMVHGLFTQTGGQFRPIIHGATSGGNYLIKTFNTISTSGAATGVTTTSGLTFTGQTFYTSAAFVYDNGNQGTSIKGPFAALWHDVIAQNTKGIAVSNLSYNSGRTTTAISNSIVANSTVIRYFLQECYERQVLGTPGNSGKVIVFINSGINDVGASQTSTDWLTATNSIITNISSIWTTTLGYPAGNLAFLLSITHPTQSGASGGNTAWFSNRASFSDAAKSFANGPTGSAYNVTYVELTDVYDANTLKGLTYYLSDGLAQAHLVTAGYTAYTSNLVTSLLSYSR